LAILALNLRAVVARTDSFAEMEDVGHSKEALLRQWLDRPGGIPSHDSVNRVFVRSTRLRTVGWSATLRSFRSNLRQRASGASTHADQGLIGMATECSIT
jgi:hypothetical protein